MSRQQSSAIIFKFYSYRIPFKSLFQTTHTKRRRVYQPSDRAFPSILDHEISLINFPFTNGENQACIRKDNLRLRQLKISF